MRLAATAALAWALAACAGAPAPEPGPEATRQPELPPLAARSVEHWLQVRRPELLGLFEQHVYGRAPTDLGAPEFEVLATDSDALAGLATRLVVHIALPTVPAWPGMDVLLYVPNDAEWPVPCFVGLNFGGNHTVTPEAGVPLPRGVLAADEHGEARRGAAAGRWPLEAILRRGFAVATAWYGDIEPDRPGGWQKGLRGAASPAGAATVWRNGDWGAIGAWAFGLSRIADYLEREVLVDADRLAVLGHSRLGKTALWAGACDPRFAVVISNDSGEGGAALMRRPVGETTANITTAFPHWFTPTYAGYADDPAHCPVDQHQLIALIAPRAVYVASASQDTWADPEGEFLAARAASPVWRLFGREGLDFESWPAANLPVGVFVGYHVRAGGHDLTAYDWEQYLAFAERHWRR